MKRFAVFSGFLGAGKTTLMMALTRYYTEHYGKAAMISNDLGEGVTLADHRYAQLGGCTAAAITDECICFCHDVLTEKLDAFFESGCELVLSDIPGFGVGALEHVYFGLSEEFPGRFELAPFTVLTEPENLSRLIADPGDDRSVICRSQLEEADLIVLNKCDLLSGKEIEDYVNYLRDSFSHAKVLAVSARRGDGLQELAEAMHSGSAALRHPDIDYDAAPLQDAFGRLCEYYLEYGAVVCCNDFDGTAFLVSLAERIRSMVAESGYELPHMKLLAWSPDGDYGKADILGTGRAAETARRFERPCTELAVILNGTASCPYAKLDAIVTEAVGAVSKDFGLDTVLFKKEGFDLGED